MSSPHVGGDFLNSMASRNTGGSGGGSGSGRNTPSSPHRSIPAQLAQPYGRPKQIATHRSSSGSDEDEEDDNGSNNTPSHGGIGWRPITPSRSSPRNQNSSHSFKDSNNILVNSYAPENIKMVRGPSSRNPDINSNGNDDSHVQSSIDDQVSYPIAPEDLDSSADAEVEQAVQGGLVTFKSLPPVLKGYLLGQIACVVKFGVWWVGFTYLILALFGGSSYLVGGTRICFNLALLICSPMAGGIAEKTNIKKLLNKTVFVRGLIYCLAIPVAWLLMDSEILWSENSALHTSFFIVFLLIIFIDGIGVSFSNVADIDSGGVNLVAAQYGIEIDDNIRNYFNSLHILFFGGIL